MRPKKQTKLISALLAAVVAASTFSGCSGSNSSSQPAASSDSADTASTASLDPSEPGWKKNSSTPITLQWYVNFSWFSQSWGKDQVSQEIKKLTGVDIEFITPAADGNNKLNTMIASNTLPDIITIEATNSARQDIVSSGQAYALNELADKYDPYFYTVTDKQKLDWYRSSDGNVYAYPNASLTPKDYEENKGKISSNQTFLVNKKMYEALGSPDMSTPESFISTLKAAKEKFPTVNGQALIPIGLTPFGDTGCYALESYLQNYLSIPCEKDGKLYDRSRDDEYVRWLKVFNQCYRDGILPKDVLIDDRNQICEKISQGRYFAIMYQASDCADQLKSLYREDPDSTYIAVRGPANEAGDPPTLAGSGSITGWCVNMITKNCKDPERAIQFFDFLMSPEGQKLTFCGVEGKAYDEVDGKIQFKKDVLDLANSDPTTYFQTYGGNYEYWMFEINNAKDYYEWNDLIPEQEPLKQINDFTKQYSCDFSVYDSPMFEAGTELYSINNDITTLWGKTLPKLIMASSDTEFDSLWKNWISQADSMGYSKIWEAKEKQFEENKAKLGIK